jgi:hypothetical protein
MTRKHLIIGFAAAAIVSVAVAGAPLTREDRKSKPVQIAQAGQKAEARRVYCYNGLKADTVDKWAPLYRGWVCIPSHLN